MTHAIRHDSWLHHRRYWSQAEGTRARHASLVALLGGVPAAALFWQLWSRVVLGPGPQVEELRYDGWAAVTVMLPASLLLVGAAAAAVAWASKAVVARAPGAPAVLALATAGLALVLAVLATTSADRVQDGASAGVEWALRGAALAVAGGVALAARWWAREAGG